MDVSRGGGTLGIPPGCLAGVLVTGLLFLVPLFFARAMMAALGRLGLPPGLAVAALVGIFLGGTVNIPVKRIEREVVVPVRSPLLFGMGRLGPRIGREGGWPFRRRVRRQTVIAVNLGGCVIPCLLAAYEIVRVLVRGPGELLALLGITALTAGVCYRAAKPRPGVGIMMPALLPPVVAAVPSLILVPDFAPPVAFTAGVLGPLIGADVLHLREIGRTATGVASIGGAGTFDGIVLSGMVAALLA